MEHGQDEWQPTGSESKKAEGLAGKATLAPTRQPGAGQGQRPPSCGSRWLSHNWVTHTHHHYRQGMAWGAELL